MAIEKTDSDNGEETQNTSSVSIDQNSSTVSESEREPYFEPVVNLPEVEVKTNEEEETELLKLRCKLFRFFNKEVPYEWKERATGDVKILHHTDKGTVRILMRQEKTLKIRANHYVTPFMELLPNCDSDRVYVWSVSFDFADEETKPETFAIKFANSDQAKLFKEKFNEARRIVTVSLVEKKETSKSDPVNDKKCAENDPNKSKHDASTKDVVDDLEKLSVSDSKKEDTVSESTGVVEQTCQ